MLDNQCEINYFLNWFSVVMVVLWIGVTTMLIIYYDYSLKKFLKLEKKISENEFLYKRKLAEIKSTIPEELKANSNDKYFQKLGQRKYS